MPVDTKHDNGEMLSPLAEADSDGGSNLPQEQAQATNAAAATAAAPPNHIHQADAFLTTTDVMNSINKSLQNLSTPNHCSQKEDDKQHIDNNSNNTSEQRTFFELQRKLPNGSTRKATPSEQAAADCHSQLQQAAQRVAQLKTWKEKAAWVEAQRQFGNALYQRQEYAQAIDVYLTCLPAVVDVVAALSFANNSNSKRQQQQQQYDDDDEREECRILFLKILNNLAQSALQLQWYNKAEQFCSLALQHVPTADTTDATYSSNSINSSNNNKHSIVFGEQVSKLYFRRGKARRLKGEYTTAREDLEYAMEWSRRVQEKRDDDDDYDDDDTNRLSSLLAQQRSIEKEQRLLQNAIIEARKNEQRQRQALQRALNNNLNAAYFIDDTPRGLRHRHVSHPASSEESGTNPYSNNKKKTSPTRPPPHHQQQRRRQYSTLRATPPPHTGEHDDEPPPSPPLSPWEHYKMMVGKVADKLLEMSTDDSYDSLRNHHVKLE